MDKQEPRFEPPSGPSESASGATRMFPIAVYNPWTQYKRYGLFAATLVVAIALGGLVGAASVYTMADNKPVPSDPSIRMQSTLTQVTKDVAALKASIETSTKSATAQISKIGERLERSERAQIEPAAKIASLTETVNRIEKRLTARADAGAGDITGSIGDRPNTTAAPAAAAKDQSRPSIVEGWQVREIYRGRAVLEHRDTLYEVVPGAELPGIGKVQSISQQNGRWVVVTPKGLIVSMR